MTVTKPRVTQILTAMLMKVMRTRIPIPTLTAMPMMMSITMVLTEFPAEKKRLILRPSPMSPVERMIPILIRVT